MTFRELIPRKHIVILLLATLFFSFLPYFNLYRQLGSQVPKLPMSVYNDANYYFDRMEEVKDGYPFLGNPYFFEHRNELPPAFFLADWFAAIPLFFGFSMMATAVINFFVWSLLFVLLAYLLFRLLDVLPRLSLIGSIFVYVQLYLLMIRPVSMQVVFPFFLCFMIFFIRWINDTENKKKQIFLGLTAAFMAYIYTYAWQIIIVTLGLTPILFFLTHRRGSLRAFFTVFGVFLLASLPLLLFTMRQIAHPLYWETIQRIGLVNTHLPTAAVFYVSIWVIAIFCLWIFLSRFDHRIGLNKESLSPFVFFTLLGLAMIVVSSSNVVSGKDLELPQHVERFIVLWFGFTSVYSFAVLCRKRLDMHIHPLSLTAGSLLFALIFFGNVMYVYTFGVGALFDEPRTPAELRKIQGFATPLAWLRENAKEPTVIWADPNAPFNSYVTMMTQHYVLFSAGGGLHLVGQDELNERFLVSHYFVLTRGDLIDDYHAYAGVGNAYHGWKTHNRMVKVCQILHLDYFGHPCGELTDRESFKGKAYFDALYKRYEKEIKPNIHEELKKYHVAFIIHDKETDRREFQPELISGTKLVYSDGRFSIYSLEKS